MYKIIGADGKEYGPVSLDQLKDWAAHRRINAQTRVQSAGSSEWQLASSVPELASLFIRPTAQGAPPILTPPAARAQQRGLAVLSFVLGLASFVLCLNVITGVPAIICGHVARRRAIRLPGRYGGAGLARAGLVLGYLSILLSLVIAAVVLPELARSRPIVQRTDCQNNLRQIGLACKVWALEHNDQFPFNVSTNAGGSLELCDRGPDGFEKNPVVHFRIVSEELSTPSFLVCPNDRRKRPATDFSSLQQNNVSYRLRTGTNINGENPQEVLTVCPIDGNELFCDGNVRKNTSRR